MPGIIAALRYPAHLLAAMKIMRTWFSAIAWMSLALATVPLPASAREEPPSAAVAPLDDELQARLAEAERLANSGDYSMAAKALDEARSRAQIGARPEALDAVERVSAQIEFRRGRYERARALYQGILERASARHDLPTVARAEMDLALLFRRRSDLTTALAGFERALALFRRLGDRDGEALVLTHIGLVRLNQGEFSTALELLRESQRLQEGGARAELERTYHYLGLLYAGMREYETAREYLGRGLREARRIADPSREAPLVGSSARIANFRGEYNEALTLALQAERLAERLESPPSLTYALLERGRALIGLNRLDEAREVLERGERIADEIRQRGTQADYLGLLAEIAQRQGRDGDALALWRRALPTYQQGHDQPQLLATLRAMIPILEARGEDDEALRIAKDSLQLQEHLSGLDMNWRMAVLETQHRAEEAEREIELLRRDNEIQALRLRSEAQGRWIGAGVVASLLIIVSLLAVRYRESRRMGRRLTRINDELLRSREALARAHEELEQKAAALARAASTDPLTGIANRRAFIEQLERQWEDAVGNRRELSVVLVDADHFKRINDTLGHAVGDTALCVLAGTIQGLLRAGTLVSRWGGEEFAILVPGADLNAAAGLAERVRAAVAAIRREDVPPLSVSIGVASLGGRPLTRPETLFEEADAALYEAKAAGRNRVVSALPRTPDAATVN